MFKQRKDTKSDYFEIICQISDIYASYKLGDDPCNDLKDTIEKSGLEFTDEETNILDHIFEDLKLLM